MKFAADIFSENSTREYLNVIHVTAEKQCLGYVAKLQTLPLFIAVCLYVKCPSETFLLRFNPFLCTESSEWNSVSRSTGPFATSNIKWVLLKNIYTAETAPVFPTRVVVSSSYNKLSRSAIMSSCQTIESKDLDAYNKPYLSWSQSKDSKRLGALN